MSDLVRGPDGIRRCAWGASTPEYLEYHDAEWGFPVVDERRLFEMLCLEGFQSGLSWLTILRKRDAFRHAFAAFDVDAVARFGRRDVERLLRDAGIVRHRGKIEATIANARAVVALAEQDGSLVSLCWSFEPTRRKAPRSFAALSSKTDESITLSKQLLRLGFRYVGPTTVYATMQATGIVNDHLVGCSARAPAQRARRALTPPRANS